MKVVVAGRWLSGMVHVGRPQRGAQIPKDLIDPTLTVAPRGLQAEAGLLPYWPSYSSISPGARANYLDWLADGARDVRIDVGYVFLYFYGIERRFFEGSKDLVGRRRLIEEIETLLALFGNSGSVRRYMGALLDAAAFLDAEAPEPAPPVAREGWGEIPLSVRLAIGRRLQAGQPIDADWAFAWLATHPEIRFRTAATRAEPEFRALFAVKFREAYPEGMRPRLPKKTMTAIYRAASGDFAVDLTSKVPPVLEISGLRAPIDALARLADAAEEELGKFSRFLGRNPDGRGTVEGHALLPETIRDAFPCPELDALRDWAEARIEAGGIIPVAELVERLEGAPAEKLGKKRLAGIADALGALGIGFAPDPRFALRAPRIDEPAVLFRLPGTDDALDQASAAYRALLLGVIVGAHVAHADGEVSVGERAALASRIDTAQGIGASERARLHANLTWSLAVPPEAGMFRKQVGEMPEDARLALARLSAAVAAADGTLDRAEMGALEKIYRALGLDPSLMHGHLHAMMTGTEPATVRPAQPGEPDFTIPGPPQAAPAGGAVVTLDQARIDAVMADTARVASVLHDIFAEDDDAEDEAQDSAPPDADARFAGLDPVHARLADRLLAAPRWSEDAFAALAAELGLMPAGAMETLNEWAFDTHDDAFLEEDDGYEINPEVAARIAAT